MSGFSFNSEAKPIFSYTFGQPSSFTNRSVSGERKPLFRFGSSTSFNSEVKEIKPKVKKQLTQEELDKKEKIKEERKKYRLELNKIKIQEAIKRSEMSYKMSDFYLKEIETFYNSLDETQSIFILSDIKTIYNLAKAFTEKAKVSYESTIKAKTIRSAETHSKQSEFAESVVFENYTKMKIEKTKKKYIFKIPQYNYSKDFNNKELSDEEMFELKVNEWFKNKNFEQIIQNICELIDNEKIKNIILNLGNHKNIMKAYKQLSVVLHSDKIDRDSNLTEFEKFKYNTVYKLINLAKNSV